MEVKFETQTQNAYQPVVHQNKKTLVSMESVVPDTNDDMGRILSVQPLVFLKSKDMNGRGASVSGEITAAILYINENEDAVSFLRLTQPFFLDFDIPEAEADMPLQIRLSVGHAETRILNPRKLSASFEICGELNGYRQDNVYSGTSACADTVPPIHCRQEDTEASTINAVCEKTFAVNEQFVLPAGKPKLSTLVSQQLAFSINDRQLVGGRVLIKGQMMLSVVWLSDEVPYPLTTRFTTPFSQLVDIGQDAMDSCSVQIEVTSAYFDPVDTINGEQAVDAEIHAVLQLVSRVNRPVSYISDAYSNLAPVRVNCENLHLSKVDAPVEISLTTQEKIELPEDCEDTLGVFASVGQADVDQGKASANAGLDVLYRSKDGRLSAVRRSMGMEREIGTDCAKLQSIYLDEVDLRPEGNALSGQISAHAMLLPESERDITMISGLEVGEEGYDFASFPAVTLVRVEDESLWELAKAYHSSPERIQSLNEMDAPLPGRLILIPKTT